MLFFVSVEICVWNKNVVNFKEGSMRCWEEDKFFCVWVECSVDVCKVHLSHNIYSSLNFSLCFEDLSSGESGVLMSPTISVWVLMCYVSFGNISFTYVDALVLGHKCSELRLHLNGFFLWWIWSVLIRVFWFILFGSIFC